ncbi:unnamed protein product, partial [Didymodactylos carnosus]
MIRFTRTTADASENSSIVIEDNKDENDYLTRQVIKDHIRPANVIGLIKTKLITTKKSLEKTVMNTSITGDEILRSNSVIQEGMNGNVKKLPSTLSLEQNGIDQQIKPLKFLQHSSSSASLYTQATQPSTPILTTTSIQTLSQNTPTNESDNYHENKIAASASDSVSNARSFTTNPLDRKQELLHIPPSTDSDNNNDREQQLSQIIQKRKASSVRHRRRSKSWTDHLQQQKHNLKPQLETTTSFKRTKSARHSSKKHISRKPPVASPARRRRHSSHRLQSVSYHKYPVQSVSFRESQKQEEEDEEEQQLISVQSLPLHRKASKQITCAIRNWPFQATYRQRSEEFKRIFKDLPNDERLIVDYSCAWQKEILIQGRMFLSQNYFCFHANFLKWETNLCIRCKDIVSLTKEKTAKVIPNAIEIRNNKQERYFFASFAARDKTYMMIFRIWQNALLDQPLSSQQLWAMVHESYGDYLDMTTDEEDNYHLVRLSTTNAQSSSNKQNKSDDNQSLSNGTNEKAGGRNYDKYD